MFFLGGKGDMTISSDNRLYQSLRERSLGSGFSTISANTAPGPFVISTTLWAR
jgi:hypothetical protein